MIHRPPPAPQPCAVESAAAPDLGGPTTSRSSEILALHLAAYAPISDPDASLRYSLPSLCTATLHNSTPHLCPIALDQHSIPLRQTITLYHHFIPAFCPFSPRHSALFFDTIGLYRHSKPSLHTILFTVALNHWSLQALHSVAALFAHAHTKQRSKFSCNNTSSAKNTTQTTSPCNTSPSILTGPIACPPPPRAQRTPRAPWRICPNADRTWMWTRAL